MNRTQALARVDEILGLFAEMYVSGSWPRCGVPLYDEEDGALPARTSATRTVVHHGPCESGAVRRSWSGSRDGSRSASSQFS
jgi:hypothetical protein